MPTINIYLTFDGNCREAFEFYQLVFGGEFLHIGTFGEMPPQEGIPPLPEEMKKRLMHISLPISKETILMGSDIGNWGPEFKVGNNFSVSVNTESKVEADKIFADLSAGGSVTMPMENSFWGSYFGMIAGKFGVNWMVNYAFPQKS